MTRLESKAVGSGDDLKKIGNVKGDKCVWNVLSRNMNEIPKLLRAARAWGRCWQKCFFSTQLKYVDMVAGTFFNIFKKFRAARALGQC